MVATLTDTAVAREAAWLTAFGDGLPALVRSAGGPWDDVQAYYPRTPYTAQRTIYVLRHQTRMSRFAAQRIINTYQFRLVCWWPLENSPGSAEDEQAAFDSALDLVLQRVLGPIGDKSHGGRFLSVGQSPPYVDIDYTDVEQTLTQAGGLRAEVTYAADDAEINA